MDPDHFEIRFMREPLGLKNFAVTYERFGGGRRVPVGHAHRRGHRHKVQEEVYFLISGRTGCARTGIQAHDLRRISTRAESRLRS